MIAGELHAERLEMPIRKPGSWIVRSSSSCVSLTHESGKSQWS